MSGRKALADWEADELRLMRSRGASLRELADRFCVSERTVERYLKDYVTNPEACARHHRAVEGDK